MREESFERDPQTAVYNPSFLASVREKRRVEQAAQKRRETLLSHEARQIRIEMLAEEARKARLAILAAKKAKEERALENIAALVVAERKQDRDMFKHIALLVCRTMRVSLTQVFGDIRSARLVVARQAIAYWACRRTNLSVAQIGRMMSRDHTTILHSKRIYVEKRAHQGRKLREAR